MEENITTNCGKLPEEFNLSEKMGKEPFNEDFIHIEDIKEFIKRLKEEIVNPIEYQCGCCCDNEKRIDKLVGDKLSEVGRWTQQYKYHERTGRS